ncbi:hypothetical protein [Bacillus mycoides]|uniref:hypothetical protein n=1 Tax=Bacillus mycoides TaxID=1405 RepID=UPI0010BE4BD8|nr:hypothetical protein [Bacillus mycoides]TKI39936.1 hypothetical protein FC700_21010 [Bacillus mycoides]
MQITYPFRSIDFKKYALIKPCYQFNITNLSKLSELEMDIDHSSYKIQVKNIITTAQSEKLRLLNKIQDIIEQTTNENDLKYILNLKNAYLDQYDETTQVLQVVPYLIVEKIYQSHFLLLMKSAGFQSRMIYPDEAMKIEDLPVSFEEKIFLASKQL